MLNLKSPLVHDIMREVFRSPPPTIDETKRKAIGFGNEFLPNLLSGCKEGLNQVSGTRNYEIGA
jgi:hypothetical protein